ncbi:MAG: family 10 glycosylhydrolase, partial [Muribaculaceae bacterium]|nr:family 10 glycosylhydrolase [Muribaculaceae bacterium]
MANHLTKIFPVLAAAALTAGVVASCKGNADADVANAEKPKQLWMCAEANFHRFADRDSITYYLEKARETGFNQVVVDVKPIQGKVLYKSDILPPLTNVDTVEVNRDWDYLQYFIDEGHRLGMKVVASACVFPAGSPWWHRGLVYDNPEFQSRTCVQYLPDGTLQPIYEDSTQVAAFLNPALKDNRELALDMLLEIINNYEIDGLALDYCRFPDNRSDFSPETKAAFEEYLGEKVENFPADIFTYN